MSTWKVVIFLQVRLQTPVRLTLDFDLPNKNIPAWWNAFQHKNGDNTDIIGIFSDDDVHENENRRYYYIIFGPDVTGIGSVQNKDLMI